ncbi:WhiB family transcriptional regulator [Actinopolyspora halophila]|uniref:WhiB family transcriptional regulator n=1 Tax=Actinopolyspora halophila TaxID=1850 RepID=UPI000A046C26
MSLRDLMKLVSQHGSCVSTDNADAWFREQPRGPSAREIQRRQAREACSGCPVRTECLTVGVAHELDTEMCWGIWGGVCSADRQELIDKGANSEYYKSDPVEDIVASLLAADRFGE